MANRKDRRELMRDKARLQKKQNKVVNQMVKSHEQKLDDLGTPATVAEVIQIATAVANDVLNNYHKQSNPVIVGLSLHMEIFKKQIIEKGWVTEEEFDKLFEESVAEFNRVRQEQLAQKAEGSATSEAVEESPTE